VNFLSPAKLLVIGVVALAVLGPDKLPTLAKQVGSLWRDFARFREKLESDVRGSFPDLPSTETITKAVRSPLTFIDTLADGQGGAAVAPDVASEEPVGTTYATESMACVEFDPSTDVHWPTETVIASEMSPEEGPVLVPAATKVVHVVRIDSGTSPVDAGSN